MKPPEGLRRWAAAITAGAVVSVLGHPISANAWRSSLYPADWTPGFQDPQGRFLHDFSHAGYHRGEQAIPDNPPGATYGVTQPPYSADATGMSDATAAIQQAIDDAGAAGGGVVYLPAGTYAVAPQGGDDFALRIRDSGVVLRGAGPALTTIHNTATDMRQKEVIKVRPSTGDWNDPLAGTSVDITTDLLLPTTTIPVTDASGFAAGDYVVLRTDVTTGFTDDHGMTGLWDPSMQGVMFFREVLAVDTGADTLTLDTPTRYYLKTRDNARVYKVAPPVEEVGIEDLSLSMAENTTAGFGDNDYTVSGTGAYEVHNSHLLEFYHALNCWARNLHSKRHPANPSDVHMLSMGILTQKSRCVTIKDCVMQKPLYKGGGGNGYMFRLRGIDCLYQDCEAIEGRHNYTFFSLYTSGNVVHRSIGRNPRYSSDFHGHLSMANLFDTMTMDGDWLQGVYRPFGTVIHGHTTTESVYWNTFGTAAGRTDIVESRAWGHAYIIGTRGPNSGVERGTADGTAPEDFLEGEGLGDTLEPESLYLDQLVRRVGQVVPHNQTAAEVIELQFQTQDGIRYALGASTDLAASNGVDSGYTVTGNGDVMRVYDPNALASNSSYHLRDAAPGADPIALFTETIDPLVWNQGIEASTSSNGNVVVSAPTPFGDGDALRMFDLSTTDKPEMQGEFATPLLEPFRIDFMSFNQSTSASSKAIRFRMANQGDNVTSESRVAFSLSWQADGKVTAKYEGGGGTVATLGSSPLSGVHTVTVVVNPMTSGNHAYSLFGENRTLQPTSYDVFIDGTLLNSSFANGLEFTLTKSAGTFDPALGLGRFGLHGSSDGDVDPDYLYDNIVVRPGVVDAELRPFTFIQPTVANGFSFLSETGTTYRLQWSTNFLPWADAGIEVEGDGTPRLLFDPAGDLTSRVYRVEATTQGSP